RRVQARPIAARTVLRFFMRGLLARASRPPSLRRYALARSGKHAHARRGGHRSGIAVRAVVPRTRTLDRDAFADVERRTGPTLSHQAVRARELEAPLDALFAFD